MEVEMIVVITEIINLLNSCYKVYSKILNNRISKIAENIVLINMDSEKDAHALIVFSL
jgi:hypothetical protein